MRQGRFFLNFEWISPRSRFIAAVTLTDALQVVLLATIPPSVSTQNLVVVVPSPSLGAFLHVFLGNLFTGTEDLVPLFSVFSFLRSIYLLLTSMSLLASSWHTSQAGAVGRVFSFAYSWVEISAYSYAMLRSFTFLRRIFRGSLTAWYVARTWFVVLGLLAIAAVLETLALTVV
ncbi:MAG TPA: hypothetical protein VFE91_03190 [Nitrososphaerales archaeon]|nr:hypothetical protein [Nitrososphaerales archaeon]